MISQSRKLFGAIIVIAVLGLCSAALQASDEDRVSVRDMGAIGDGHADDTQAFLKAVAIAKVQRKPVYVPWGKYLISKTIELDGVALNGPAGGAWPADMDALPSIIPTQRSAPAFHLGAAGAIHWIDIVYKWDKEPVSGPPAVLVSGNGTYISNVRIRYAWDGIITDGINNVGRANFENIFMVAIRNVGVRVTGTWDVARLSNVEVWNAAAGLAVPTKGIGFLLGKNDLIRLSDCFVFGMFCGYRLVDKIDGCPIKGGTWGVMNGCASDFCTRGIEIEGENNISVSGGTYWSHRQGLTVDGAGSRVRVSGCEFKSNGAPVVLIRNCDHTVITGCTLIHPMKEHLGRAVLLTGGRVVLGSNHIDSTGDGVCIGPGVGSAVITGNDIEVDGHAAIVDEHGSKSKVLIGDNLLEDSSLTPTTRPSAH